MAKDIYRGPLEQVDECCWRIPKSYRPGMRVDGLIFADEGLLKHIRQDQAPEQVANVAYLPGIQYASLAMPDIHWGYGFCIGGVCATDPDEGGVISPGGVGYDINCLTGDSRVLSDFGAWRRIDDYVADGPGTGLICCDLAASRRTITTAQGWFGREPHARVLRVATEAGDEITATADHPFWTPQGMVPLGQLRPGDTVGVAGFEGLPFEPPAHDILLSEEVFAAHWARLGLSPHGLGQAVAFLKARGLLPLVRSSAATALLCKVLGFVFGDGHITFLASGKGVVGFSGRAEDLELIRADLARLGVTPSRVYSRERCHAIDTAYAHYEFDRTEESCKVVGTAFAALLAALGAPVGKKTSQAYDVPPWLDAGPAWHRRLFLAAYFGAEMTSPRTVPGHDTVFTAPTVTLNKRPGFVDSGRGFLEHLSAWLKELGIATQALVSDPAQINANGERSERVRLILTSDTDNLIRLWGTVGFEYNARRTGLAALAVQYLKIKRRHLDTRAAAAVEARRLREQGVGLKAIAERLAGTVNRRFIERTLYEPADRLPRVAQEFPTFRAFCAEADAGGVTAGLVWQRLAVIEEVEQPALVYDFTVAHPDHNFIANGFVVSNCGVRLVRTNLSYRDVKGALRTLVEDLFRTIPTGAGKEGRYHFKGTDLDRILAEGSRTLVSRGLATPADIDMTEASGRLDGADPHALSDRARQRGQDQCGTLGSGNHFLEVQVVDHVFDEEVAAVFGLEKDQVCVMIHSGSRGLGYQVCDDALASLRKAPEKYGIQLPDRQLACAPVDSPEGKHYIAAMRAAANFAWCNRQLLMHQAREVFARVFGQSWQSLGMTLLYDVCHNIAKFEEHTVNGRMRKVWVHRKGATRAFPPGHPEVPAVYRAIGQPVIIPGDMGRASWILVGQPGSMERTFGTTCHGAGRAMSRTAAVQAAAGRRIDRELEARGVIARAQSRKGLAEEQPKAYKNVDEVVDVVHRAGLSHKVARMRPIGVIKG